MDPLTALSLVGNVIQFVDFGLEILSTARGLQKSAEGAVPENVDTEIVVKDLQVWNARLKDSAGPTSNEALSLMSQRCEEVADELLIFLEKLKSTGKKTRWKSVRSALESAWKKEKVDEMRKRLEGFRDEINLHILVDLRVQLSTASVKQSKGYEALETDAKNLYDAIIGGQDIFKDLLDTNASTMQRLHLKTSEAILHEHHSTRLGNQEEHIKTRIEVSERNRTEHMATRSEILLLRQSLGQNKLEMDQRSHELENLLLEFRKAQNARTREQIRERTKAVTTAIMSLKEVYEDLQAYETSIQTQAQPKPSLLLTQENLRIAEVERTRDHFLRSDDFDFALSSHPKSSPRPTLPVTPNAYGETALRTPRPHRIIAVEDEEAGEESEEFESDRNYSYEDQPSPPPLVSRATPTSAQRVQIWQDSGYSGSTRGSKREKDEVYRASLSRVSSNGSLAEEGSSDDSDDDFERRLMKVATYDNSQVDVHAILDTGTKPDWISSRFLTEKLGLKYTKLNDEENKQQFSDFNGNKFNGIGKAELMVNSTNFIGFPSRTISFLVAKGGTFQILLGSRTIKKEKLLCKPLNPQRKGVFPAVQIDPKKGTVVLG